MPTLVHLTTAGAADKVRRQGLTPSATHFPFAGIYASPVLAEYPATEHWLSQIAPDGRSVLAVHFVVPDDEPVEVGHLGRRHAAMTAVDAIALLASRAEAAGYELFVLRRIAARDIVDIKHAPRVTSWPYQRSTVATPCDCPICTTE